MLSTVQLDNVTIRGYDFLVRSGTSDLKTIQYVFEDPPGSLRHGTYEKVFPILQGERWIDFGGHIGSFAVLALSKGAKVHSWEPHEVSAPLYKQNVTQNGFKASLTQAMVLQKCKEATGALIINEKNPSSCSSHNIWKKERPRATVACVSFEKAIEKSIKHLGKDGPLCLKIDIEGAELEIMDVFDRTDISKMVIEWHFTHDKSLKRIRKCIRRLQKLGYQVQLEEKLPKGDTWNNPMKGLFMVYAWRAVEKEPEKEKPPNLANV